MKAMHDMDGTTFDYRPILEGKNMSTHEDALKQTISDLEYIADFPGSVLPLLEKRRDELKELKEEYTRLLKNLGRARDRSYEATMGDYSMVSINNAQAQVEAAKKAFTDAGYEVPTW